MLYSPATVVNSLMGKIVGGIVLGGQDALLVAVAVQESLCSLPRLGPLLAQFQNSHGRILHLMRTKSPMPQVVDALRIGADTEGGYLVPDEYEHTLVAQFQNSHGRILLKIS